MAITRQLQDEADRAIAGITKYYEQFGDTLLDAEEREHRISKIAVALEGCNGITDKEKLQKTAENLFGLTCAWERDSLALKREIMVSREKTDAEFSKLEGNMEVMGNKIDTLCQGLEDMSTSFKTHMEQSKCTNSVHSSQKNESGKLQRNFSSPWYYRLTYLLDRHFTAASFLVIVIAFLLVLSGNLDWFSKIIGK